MEVPDDDQKLTSLTSHWLAADNVEKIKAGTLSQLGAALTTPLKFGWGGTWDTKAPIQEVGLTNSVIRNRFLPVEADTYTSDYRFARAQPIFVGLFDDRDGGSWLWEDVTIQGAVAGVSASIAVAMGAFALSF